MQDNLLPPAGSPLRRASGVLHLPEFRSLPLAICTPSLFVLFGNDFGNLIGAFWSPALAFRTSLWTSGWHCHIQRRSELQEGGSGFYAFDPHT